MVAHDGPVIGLAALPAVAEGPVAVLQLVVVTVAVVVEDRGGGRRTGDEAAHAGAAPAAVRVPYLVGFKLLLSQVNLVS